MIVHAIVHRILPVGGEIPRDALKNFVTSAVHTNAPQDLHAPHEPNGAHFHGGGRNDVSLRASRYLRVGIVDATRESS